jgi:histone H3/H4
MAKKTTSKPEAKAKPKAAAGEDKKARGAFISRAPIRRLMKVEGASLCSEKAVTLLIDKLTDLAQKITKAAIKNMKADNRKRVTAADIQMARREVK